jgi:hypothetical protein
MIEMAETIGRSKKPARGFNVGPGSWMDEFTRAHGTDSTLLMWGRRLRKGSK